VVAAPNARRTGSKSRNSARSSLGESAEESAAMAAPAATPIVAPRSALRRRLRIARPFCVSGRAAALWRRAAERPDGAAYRDLGRGPAVERSCSNWAASLTAAGRDHARKPHWTASGTSAARYGRRVGPAPTAHDQCRAVAGVSHGGASSKRPRAAPTSTKLSLGDLRPSSTTVVWRLASGHLVGHALCRPRR